MRAASAASTSLSAIPRALSSPLQIEFSRIAQVQMDRDGKELTSEDLWSLFSKTYLLRDAPVEKLTGVRHVRARLRTFMHPMLKIVDGELVHRVFHIIPPRKQRGLSHTQPASRQGSSRMGRPAAAM